jgi:geranylgeranyl reductase family protein
MIEDEYDVVVVGAGPAGALASHICAGNGLRTLLVEALSMPRDKLCGGGVAPWVIRELNVPAYLIERTIERVQVIAGSKTILTMPIPNEIAYRMVLRHDFDHFLVRRAEQAGAAVKEGTRVRSVIRNTQGAVLGIVTDTGKIRAKLTIGCDGASSTVARSAGFWEKWWPEDANKGWRKHQAFCLETQIQLSPEAIDSRISNTMMLFFEKDFPGYYWVFPKKQVLTVGVGSFSDLIGANVLRERLNRLIQLHPVASEVLEGSQRGSVKGAYLPIRGPLSPLYAAGVILAGDSAAQVGSVWGEGIYFAVRAGIAAGETAVQAIQEDDVSARFLSEYENRCEETIGKSLSIQADILRNSPTPLDATTAYAEHLFDGL